MTFWKQALLSLLLMSAAVVAAAIYVPAAHPALDRVGLLAPLDRLGLVRRAPEGGAGASGGGFGGGPAIVVAGEARDVVLSDRVTAIGTARGARSVILAPEVAGRVVSVDVASGDFVEAGQMIVALDSEAARIALDRARLVTRDAQATRDRLARLQATGATTDLQVRESELALQTARLEEREAEFDLQRHSITAPIAGWVGILTIEIGNQVAPGDEITRIEDRSSLIVDFRVPERVVSRIGVGDKLSASPLADPGTVLEGRITALDNRVDEASRTLQVQAAIRNDDDRMRPGMAFLITLEFTGARHPAVDPLSIQWRAEGPFVWVVREDKAQRVPVRILQRNSDMVLIEAELRPGDRVVTEGVQTLRPGGEVVLAPETDATPEPKT